MTVDGQRTGQAPDIGFRVGQVSVKPVLGDICDLQAEVLVDSTRTSAVGRPLQMSKWVRKANTDDSVGRALIRQMPLRLGNVIVTDAGTLKARYILHAVVLDWAQTNVSSEVTINQAVVSDVARRCIRIAAALGVRSVAFTPWGTFVGAIEAAYVTALMVQAISQEVKAHSGDLEVIYLISNEPEHYRWFVDRSFVFHVVLDQLNQVSATVSDLDIPDAVRDKILGVLKNARQNVVVYNEIYGGEKYNIRVEEGKGIVIGDQASAKVNEASAKPDQTVRT